MILQAVTTAVALEFGLGSSLFAVALCFTVITMYDAAGVRRHAGQNDCKLLPLTAAATAYMVQAETSSEMRCSQDAQDSTPSQNPKTHRR